VIFDVFSCSLVTNKGGRNSFMAEVMDILNIVSLFTIEETELKTFDEKCTFIKWGVEG
jgi:hypothetical protein